MSETGHINIILLGIIVDDQILHLNFSLDPFLISQAGPDMVRLGDNSFVRFHDTLSLLYIHVQCSHDEHESRESSKT